MFIKQRMAIKKRNMTRASLKNVSKPFNFFSIHHIITKKDFYSTLKKEVWVTKDTIQIRFAQ